MCDTPTTCNDTSPSCADGAISISTPTVSPVIVGDHRVRTPSADGGLGSGRRSTKSPCLNTGYRRFGSPRAKNRNTAPRGSTARTATRIAPAPGERTLKARHPPTGSAKQSTSTSAPGHPRLRRTAADRRQSATAARVRGRRTRASRRCRRSLAARWNAAPRPGCSPSLSATNSAASVRSNFRGVRSRRSVPHERRRSSNRSTSQPASPVHESAQ